MSEFETKKRAEGSSLVTELLRRHLDKDVGASIVVPGAEGWRHCSSNENLTPKEIKAESFALRRTSLDRINSETFSPGEEDFFESELAQDF